MTVIQCWFNFFELMLNCDEKIFRWIFVCNYRCRFFLFFEPSPPHNSQRIRANTDATGNTYNTYLNILTHTNTYQHNQTPPNTSPISSTDAGPLHSKCPEACTVMLGHLFLARCEHVRPITNGPKHTHSDTLTSQSRMYTERADWTRDHCHCFWERRERRQEREERRERD